MSSSVSASAGLAPRRSKISRAWPSGATASGARRAPPGSAPARAAPGLLVGHTEVVPGRGRSREADRRRLVFAARLGQQGLGARQSMLVERESMPSHAPRVARPGRRRRSAAPCARRVGAAARSRSRHGARPGGRSGSAQSGRRGIGKGVCGNGLRQGGVGHGEQVFAGAALSGCPGGQFVGLF